MAHKLSPDQELVLAAASLGLEQEVRSGSEYSSCITFLSNVLESKILNLLLIGKITIGR